MYIDKDTVEEQTTYKTLLVLHWQQVTSYCTFDIFIIIFFNVYARTLPCQIELLLIIINEKL